jgi:septal ring factor EnvC (AmiA/AmiB activator)
MSTDNSTNRKPVKDYFSTVIRGTLFIWILLLAQPPLLLAQSKQELERRRIEQLKRIEEANRILRETSQEKGVSLGRLNAINAAIRNREELIRNTRKEIQYLNHNISETELIISALERDLADMKKEYARLIYQASKIHSSYNKLIFLFSSSSFNQFFRRLNYLRQYSNIRAIQFEEIEKTKQMLASENRRVMQQRKEKERALLLLEEETQKLNNLKEEKNKAIEELNKRERELRAKLQEEQKALAQLEEMIVNAVKEEIKKSGDSEGKKMVLTPEGAAVAKSFESNQGKLPWPVKVGFIAQPFGISEHPVLEKIYINNYGVKIQTQRGESVYAVFGGKVEKVFTVPGHGYAIMISHGNYFTSYSNLSQVLVKDGQEVQIGQKLGVALTDHDGVTTIQFYVYKNQTPLNPEDWLAKK